ncbi:hypothetical protein PVAP13_5NG217900 [Panicum virgatum]|uniref:Uncharacterized protein n=1 Tax=Panicum virgatum TaxID=38727 RepID=A0A8T0RPN9_PANVG|nr:hypothetical protein PVAP13_5NG217900 [Panicum virgatum]
MLRCRGTDHCPASPALLPSACPSQCSVRSTSSAFVRVPPDGGTRGLRARRSRGCRQSRGRQARLCHWQEARIHWQGGPCTAAVYGPSGPPFSSAHGAAALYLRRPCRLPPTALLAVPQPTPPLPSPAADAAAPDLPSPAAAPALRSYPACLRICADLPSPDVAWDPDPRFPTSPRHRLPLEPRRRPCTCPDAACLSLLLGPLTGTKLST